MYSEHKYYKLECTATLLWELFTSCFSGYWSMWSCIELLIFVLLWQHMKKLLLSCLYAEWVMIFWTPETAYVECCKHWVEVSDLSIGSGVTWWPKVEEGVVQRKEITRFGKCRYSEIVTENVIVEDSKTEWSTWVWAGFLSRWLKTDV